MHGIRRKVLEPLVTKQWCLVSKTLAYLTVSPMEFPRDLLTSKVLATGVSYWHVLGLIHNLQNRNTWEG